MGFRTVITLLFLVSSASASLTVSYTIWIGLTADMTFSTDLEAPDGSFFSDVMEQASLKNPFFQYSCGADFSESNFDAYDDRYGVKWNKSVVNAFLCLHQSTGGCFSKCQLDHSLATSRRPLTWRKPQWTCLQWSQTIITFSGTTRQSHYQLACFKSFKSK